MIALIAAVAVALPQTGLLSYEQSVRCAGLTQAASELEGGESGRGRQLFDAALFWSLAAMQAAEASGRPTLRGEADQTRERVRAVRELSGDQAEAREALAQCLTRTPDLN